MKKSIYILQVTIGIILLSHAIPGIFDGGINAFGEFFLNAIGFAPFGIAIAWAVKLSHVVCAVALFANKFVKLASIITIFVLIMGIVLVHFKEGWFVVGGGRNGIEYNVLMIMVLIAIMAEAKQKVFSSRKES